MLLLNHIFSRIHCPMKITHMCVQSGWQPAGCPEPQLSELLWGTPRDGDRASLDCQEAGELALGSSLPFAGLGVGDVSSGQHFKGGIFYGMVNLGETSYRPLRDRKSGQLCSSLPLFQNLACTRIQLCFFFFLTQ